MSKFVIVLTVMMGGSHQEVRLETQYDSIAICEAAKATAEQKYKQEHPDAEIQSVVCAPL